MQKLLLRMMLHPHETVTAAYVAYMRKRNDNYAKGRTYLESQGFEAVDDEGLITADGREVFGVYGKRWALNKEEHQRRIDAAIEEKVAIQKATAAGTETTKAVAGSEALSALTCPRPGCGDVLQHLLVCPKCEAGKIGYSHRYMCSCGVDFVTKEEL